MPKLDERQAVEQVTVRLSARFPNLPTTLVRTTVRDEHAKLDGRVRDYVPVLVERAARQRLGMIATIDG
ncbi:three-helix bundle dimerization domain-containing protein [Pengzhenrongella phosphoraccumulans]|uniref:three-helix bundle dimerization domain-containing protein n=1 Tax=Pengzhenrongella phosphoraccumulans TaxID=3114394 RepID=UPI003890EC30